MKINNVFFVIVSGLAMALVNKTVAMEPVAGTPGEVRSFSPETEVESVLDENTGRYVIRPINPYKKMQDQIRSEEKAKKEGIFSEFMGIKRREEELAQENPGFAAYLKNEREEMQKKLEEIEKDVIARAAARKIIVEKWIKELDQDIGLDAKIVILKQWADKIAATDPWQFFENLEKVKRDFLVEKLFHPDELTETDEQKYQHELEELVSSLTDFNKIKAPGSDETIATQWINAETQEQKNQVIKNLIKAVKADYFNLSQQAGLSIEYLKEFISPEELTAAMKELRQIQQQHESEAMYDKFRGY